MFYSLLSDCTAKRTRGVTIAFISRNGNFQVGRIYVTSKNAAKIIFKILKQNGEEPMIQTKVHLRISNKENIK